MTRYPLDPYPFGWFLAIYAEDLKPCAVQPLVLHDRHFVLWRDEQGEPHACDAFCAHLGAHLGHGGRVNGATIRCPFHAWTYDARGRCVEIPYNSHRPPERAAIASYPVVERNGIVWVWWHPNSDSPTFGVPKVPEWRDPLWTHTYVRQHWRVRTQWREIAENGVDLTHFHYLHGVLAIPELTFVSTDGPIWHSIATHEVRTPVGPRPSSFEVQFHGPGFGWLRFRIDDLAEILFLITIAPIDMHQVDLRFSFLSRRPLPEDGADFGPALIQEVIDQVTDDVPIWEHKIIKDPPLLAKGDGPIMAFRQWAAQFSVASMVTIPPRTRHQEVDE
ncbi:MAG: Rieske 2Fe-2S domain-containing protein [Bacilli bacterium]